MSVPPKRTTKIGNVIYSSDKLPPNLQGYDDAEDELTPYAYYQRSTGYTPPVVAGPKAIDPNYNEIDPLLRHILEAKRATRNPELAAFFMETLLRLEEIPYKVDSKQNFTVEIPQDDGSKPSVCFTSHTDTVHNSPGYQTLEAVEGFLQVKGGGVLGADDGAGIYIMIQMIRAKVPGLYCFFAQEETGRIGSKAYTMPLEIEVVVSFDRKGTNNLITHQSNTECCSARFADDFISKFSLPFVKDPTGVFTDSFTFNEEIAECINLSVGYYDQHTQKEKQDLKFLENMVDACILMDWHSLIIARIPPADLVPEGLVYDGFTYTELLDFCSDNPFEVTEFLELYGFTLEDIIAASTPSETTRSLSSKKKSGANLKKGTTQKLATKPKVNYSSWKNST